MENIYMSDTKLSKEEIKYQSEEQIMKAAIGVFTLQRYATAIIQKITGVAVGTSYKYYASKGV